MKNLIKRYWLCVAWICIITFILLFGSCKSNERVIEKTKVEYRTDWKDTTIYVPIPYERIVEKVPYLDTLHIENSYAYTNVWLDTATYMLNGHLVSKDCQIPNTVKLPTKTVTQTEYKTINKTIVIKEKISFFEKLKLVLLGMSIGVILLIIREFIVNLKK